MVTPFDQHASCFLSDRVQCMFDHAWNIGECHAPFQEGINRYFIGSVQNGRHIVTRRECLICQAQTRKFIKIRLLEIEMCNFEQIQGIDAAVDSVGISHRMCNRYAHIRIAQLRNHGAISIGNH